MTEKQYGGNTGRGSGENSARVNVERLKPHLNETQNKNQKDISSEEDYKRMNKEDKEKIIKAGKIASEVKAWIKPQIKKDMSLVEIAEKIESRIFELGGEPAFPVNLSIDNVAAHYTPSHDDETKAHGLLKVDFGVHIDGWTADNAFSIDLENNEENKKLIEASKEALENAIEIVRENKEQTSTNQIGKKIQETIESNGFSPVINLSGHSMEQYQLHSGITIPNVGGGKEDILNEGLYAIEPFATNGSGKVKDGKPSGIYELISEKGVRSPIAREVLKFITEEYETLPFCSRWIVKKFGTKALFGLKQLEDNGNLHHFSQLAEISGSKVSQAEQTILIEKDKVIVTTE
ncbi:MAG: type II methionyl aminopeptidase [Candidatus Pacearchaeota archaeon]